MTWLFLVVNYGSWHRSFLVNISESLKLNATSNNRLAGFSKKKIVIKIQNPARIQVKSPLTFFRMQRTVNGRVQTLCEYKNRFFYVVLACTTAHALVFLK